MTLCGHFADKYGITREVDYVADKNGFRAIVRSNEPGTAPKVKTKPSNQQLTISLMRNFCYSGLC